MKKLLALFSFVALAVSCLAQPSYVRNPLDTNSLALPPDDSYIVGVVGGKPAWILGGTNTTFVQSFITNSLFNTYISTNVFNTFFATTINSTTLNISGKASVKYFVLTNQVAYVPQAWSGPTNILDLSLTTGAEEWTYTTFTPVRISGLAFDTGYVERGLLSVTNASTTNITITFVGGFKTPVNDSSSTYTVTNGDYAEILVEYRNGPSNQVTRVWH